ncbi:MAG: hypothetical protein OXF68_09290 [Gammaproteobacteria bacterium]|nr:hypothetical protein [Gammaproteobacteria bacterium]
MPDVSAQEPHGALRTGWSATVDDYAIAGGWTARGDTLAVADSAGGVYAFEGKSGACAWGWPGRHDGGALALAVHPDGATFATAGQDGHVLIWDVAGGEVKQAIEVGRAWVENLAWSPDGRLLAASCSRQVAAYGEDGREAWRSDDHPSTVSAIAWSNAGELATACYGRVTFFDASTGEAGQQLSWKGSLVSMALSPDGDVVACGSQDNSVHFWRRSTEQDSMMSGYPGKPSALAFDDAGTLLATSGGPMVTVWSFQDDGPEGTRPGALELHVQPVTTLAFARRALRLASGGRDGGVVVWSLKKSGEGGAIGAAVVADLVAELHWRPDGRALAALDAQGGVTVWRTR